MKNYRNYILKKCTRRKFYKKSKIVKFGKPTQRINFGTEEKKYGRKGYHFKWGPVAKWESDKILVVQRKDGGFEKMDKRNAELKTDTWK